MPLVSKESGDCVLVLVHGEPGHYTQRHAELATGFDQQVPGAIENARPFQEARDRAALEERQRLELHDSVSQVLYSITLNAASGEALQTSNPEHAIALRHDVHELARAGG